MIQLIQSVIERHRCQSTDLLLLSRASSPSSFVSGIDKDSERDRMRSLDDTLDRSERKKAGGPGSGGATSTPVGFSPPNDEEKNKIKQLVDVIKAGLNCLTRFVEIVPFSDSAWRWTLHHPTLVESDDMKELFLEVCSLSVFLFLSLPTPSDMSCALRQCFDVCSIYPTVANLIPAASLPGANRDDSSNPPISPVDHTAEPLAISSAPGGGVSQSHHLASFSFAMNYIAEEEKLMENIRSGLPFFSSSLTPPDQLPKILHKTEGAFSLSDIIAVIFHNQDQEFRVRLPPPPNRT
jgi:hypothetical protein